MLVLFHSIPLYTFTPQYFRGKCTLLQLLLRFRIRFQLKTPDHLWKYDVSQIKVDKGAVKSDPPWLLDIKVLFTCWCSDNKHPGFFFLNVTLTEAIVHHEYFTYIALFCANLYIYLIQIYIFWIIWVLFYCGIGKWCEHFFHRCIYTKMKK